MQQRICHEELQYFCQDTYGVSRREKNSFLEQTSWRLTGLFDVLSKGHYSVAVGESYSIIGKRQDSSKDHIFAFRDIQSVEVLLSLDFHLWTPSVAPNDRCKSLPYLPEILRLSAITFHRSIKPLNGIHSRYCAVLVAFWKFRNQAATCEGLQDSNLISFQNRGAHGSHASERGGQEMRIHVHNSKIRQYLSQKRAFPGRKNVPFHARLLCRVNCRSSCAPPFLLQNTFNPCLEIPIKLLKFILHRHEIHQNHVQAKIILLVRERRAAGRDLAGFKTVCMFPWQDTVKKGS